MKKINILFLFVTYCTFASATEHANWKLLLAEDPLSGQTACLMVSATRHTEDGRTRTPVSIIYNGAVFIAETRSNIDMSYSDLGLQVDAYRPHHIDRVHKKTSVVFTDDAEKIRQEFSSGLTGKLTLGFWPTWPKTRRFTIDFDLHGFTQTYRAFRRCQSTGELP